MKLKTKLTFALAFISGAVWAQANTFPSNGNAGVNTLAPAGNLQVKGLSYWDASTTLFLTNNAVDYGRTSLILTGRFQNNNDGWSFGSAARNAIVFAQNASSSAVNVGSIGDEKYSLQLEGNSNSLGFMSKLNGNNPNLVITQTGNIGINTSTPNEKLSVNGKIRAQEIKVETANWPDYVFADDYKLMSLAELEKYVVQHKHLPEIPTANDVEKNGIDLGEMNKLLLKKIEELTLYLIEIKKENTLLNSKLDMIKNKR